MRAFVNGSIGPPFRAAGVLVEGDRIATVAPDDTIRALARERGAEIVDLERGTLLPGFQDAHVHLYLAGQHEARLDLAAARSIAEVEREVRAFAARESAPVLYAFGLDESQLLEKRLPTRDELSDVAGDRPLVVFRACRHVAVLNGRALEKVPAEFALVDRMTGRIEEDSLFRLEKEVFVPSTEERRRWIRQGEEKAFSLGITTVHEIKGAAVAEAYRAMAADGSLRLRVFYFLYGEWEEALRARDRFAGLPIHFGGYKIFADGTIGAETAAVHEPYAGGGRGSLMWDDQDLKALFMKAARAEMPVMCHAIGDRAIDQLLRVRLEAGGSIPFLRMEHVEMLREKSLADVVRGGWKLCLQPNFAHQWQGAGGFYETRLGQERARSMNRIRSWHDAGVPVAFGSDGMPIDPLYGMRSAMEHPNPEERFDWEDAFSLYSRAPESFVQGGGDAGAIAEGMRADLNWVRVPHQEIQAMRTEDIRLTLAGGEVVHER
ncbi:MAG: amidohydrolase [Gemmatimonadetes bacterium]|nr:amidohydrolase [Gemmatimonadota bacterium]